MRKKGQLVVLYLLCDYIAAATAWGLFFRYRKLNLEPRPFGYSTNTFDPSDEKFILSLLLIPVCWILFYAFTGNYNNVYRKYRFNEFVTTLVTTLIGCVIIFFALLLDDQIATYRNYYTAFGVLFAFQFGFTFFLRYILTSRTVRRVKRGVIGFNTLLIGGGQAARDIYNDITGMKDSPGNRFVGYVAVEQGPYKLTDTDLEQFTSLEQADNALGATGIEEVIVALDEKQHHKMGAILNYYDGRGIVLKVIPDMYDILSGSVKMSSIYGTPLIEIDQRIMPTWQIVVKRAMDIGVSILALTLLAPLYALIAIAVKLDSPGPVFFKQERIGLRGQPFDIYKFRTMRVDAEKDGPQLSSTYDSRITKIGLKLRKTRLDEFPQFYNVLIGEMSLVGPRPERQHYIDLITEQAPHYRHLSKVRPGITSWGQVKYGYAENVEEMIQRLKFDVLYIENMSLAVDLKILAYTVLTVLKGSGK